jgi:O-antigen ligase
VTSPELRRRAEAGAKCCAVGLGFSIPVSSALDNVLLLVFLVLWLAGDNLAAKLRAVRNHPVGLTALLFAVVLLLGTIWSPLPITALRNSVSDALRFVLLGLFAVVFLDSSTRARAQFAFLLASTLILALSFLFWSGLIDAVPGLKGRPDYPVVFKYHITHNILMAVAALLFALHALDAKNRRARALLWLLAGAATVNVFLLIPGRTGQLALATAIVYLGLARFGWRGLLVAGTALLALGSAVWLTPNSVMHERFAKAWQEAGEWQPGEIHTETSVGLRLQFYRNSLVLIAEHPLFGAGTGAFRPVYAAHVRGTKMVVADHPHNAFLHVGVELGLFGLAALLALLVVQWRSARWIAHPSGRIAARGLIVIFVVAGLVSSTFGDHAEGLFFAWASGLLFASARPPDKTPVPFG